MAFNSIPADRIVSVVPSAIGTGGTALSMSTMLVSPQGTPRIVGVREFGSDTEVGQFFGLASEQYKFAQRYFLGYEGATKLPDRIWIAGAKDSAQGAILQSASMRGLTVEDIKQSGDLIITVNGTAYTATVDLTGATSFSDAAGIISAALTTAAAGAECIFVPSTQVFEIKTSTTGPDESISFASGALASVLRLREEDGAVTENGTDSMSIDELMSYCLSKTQNFAVITFLDELEEAQKKTAANWTSLRKSRFLTVIQDTSGAAITANNPASFGAWLAETEQDGTLPYYGSIDKVAALCGGIAAIDFKRTNGRRNIMFMRQAGLAADVTNEADYAALISNGYTFYAAFGTANDRFQFQTNGEVAGKFRWADNYVNQIYFNSQLQLALMTMLISYGSIPYNDAGKAYHRAAVLDPINEMINFGGIRPLIDQNSLSEQQKSIINSQAGRDVVPDLLNKGYAVVIENADAQTRGNRGSMPFSVFYTDGGSTQSVSLASVNVQ